MTIRSKQTSQEQNKNILFPKCEYILESIPLEQTNRWEDNSNSDLSKQCALQAEV